MNAKAYFVAAGVVATAAAAWWGAALAQSPAAKAPTPLHLEGSAGAEPWSRYRDWTKNTWPKYNTLVERTRTPKPGKEIAIADDSIKGDAENGRALAFNRQRGGGCLACHVMGPRTQELPGNAGIDLSEIGAAGRTDQHLYNYVYDARVYNPDSIMPPWGAHGFYKPEEIRDIVAFLKTLKTPATFKTALDDPEKRPLPVEDRDGLDPFVNPAAARIEVGEALTKAAGPNGKSCVSCHATLATTYKAWSAAMPRWEPQLNKVLGVEEFVARHARATTGADWRMQSEQNTDMTVYLRNLSNGLPIKIDLSTSEAQAAAKRGEELTRTKIGEFNMGCVDCHTKDKGGLKWLRGQWLGEFRGQLDHFPLWRTSRFEVWDVRKRLQWCNVQVRADELPPDAAEYGELEIYLMSLNDGLKLQTPNIRH
jgi:sulfur-oxidizing protein SoxA